MGTSSNTSSASRMARRRVCARSGRSSRRSACRRCWSSSARISSSTTRTAPSRTVTQGRGGGPRCGREYHRHEEGGQVVGQGEEEGDQGSGEEAQGWEEEEDPHGGRNLGDGGQVGGPEQRAGRE